MVPFGIVGTIVQASSRAQERRWLICTFSLYPSRICRSSIRDSSSFVGLTTLETCPGTTNMLARFEQFRFEKNLLLPAAIGLRSPAVPGWATNFKAPLSFLDFEVFTLRNVPQTHFISDCCP
jgi:hypothetical protein